MLAGGLGRRQPALAHERDRLGNRHRPGGSERRILADGVPDHVVRLDPRSRRSARMARLVATSVGLLELRLDELLQGCLEAEPAQVEPGCLASLLEDPHRRGLGSAISRPIPASSDPCPGKQKATLLTSCSIPSEPTPR